MELTIRPAGSADLEAIRAIYNHYVAASTCTYELAPESAEARAAWFAEHGPRHPVTVAEMGGEIAGWGALSLYNRRAGYARTVEDSIYVRAGYTRRGVGRALLADLILRAEALDHHVIVAGIDAEQAGSVALHSAFGFREAGRLVELGYKFGRTLDVIYMQRFVRARETTGP